MNVSEYIESGILESYAVGSVSDQERREVECLSSVYPEIRQELEQLSAVLENYVLMHSIEPPASIKTKLLEQLNFDAPQLQQQETIVRPMPVDIPSAPTYRVTWIAAAVGGLVVLSFAFYLLSQLRTTQQTMATTRKTNETLQTQLSQLQANKVETERTLALLRQPGLRTLELVGNEKAPAGNMLVFWNTKTHQVAIQVKSLPPLPADKQYQLWSLVGSKPVDAGVFDGNTEPKVVQRLNRQITQADAFAVTVEKKGGNLTPTLATLLAMTPVKG